MKTTAVRLYGKRDLRLETFELPPLGDGDILARVVSDSVCMSTYKAASQGENHKRVPNDVHDNPIIVGHEFCGEILEVGARWQDEFKPGQRFSIQPALNDPDDPFSTPGYAFKYLGGDASLACSAQTQAKIDQQVVDLVKEQHQKALQLLQDNRRKLDEISKYLYEKETITGDEFMALLNAK